MLCIMCSRKYVPMAAFAVPQARQTDRTSTKRIRMTIMKHKEEQEQEQEQEQEEEQEEAVVNACTHNIHTYTRLQQCEAALALDAVRAVFATLTRGHHRQQQTWPPVAATVVAVQVFCFPLPETAGCRRCSPRAANRQPSDCTHTHPRPRSAPAAHQSQTQAQPHSTSSMLALLLLAFVCATPSEFHCSKFGKYAISSCDRLYSLSKSGRWEGKPTHRAAPIFVVVVVVVEL